jgi:hypothetical protein
LRIFLSSPAKNDDSFVPGGVQNHHWNPLGSTILCLSNGANHTHTHAHSERVSQEQISSHTVGQFGQVYNRLPHYLLCLVHHWYKKVTCTEHTRTVATIKLNAFGPYWGKILRPFILLLLQPIVQQYPVRIIHDPFILFGPTCICMGSSDQGL